MTSEGKKGLSRILADYKVGQKVAIDIDPSQPKGLPHRRFQGRVGIIKEIRRRSAVVSIMMGQKEKKPVVRFEHIMPVKS